MANKITRTIKTTTILYVIYGGAGESEPLAITCSGILSDEKMWKAVKKVGGPKAVVWDYHYNEGKYSMDIDTFINNAVKEDE